MERSTYNVSTPGFVADHHSINLNSGRQIAWGSVPGSYADEVTGKKVLPAGTVVSELANGQLVPTEGGVGGAGGAVGILVSNAVEGAPHHALSGYGVIVGGVIYEELLPHDITAAMRTALDEAGTGFAWETYSDNRAS
jgi:hypothetical protein